MDTNIQLYDDKIRPINRIEFNILGNDEVRRMSALNKETAGIEIPDLYDNLEPKRGGMIDTRMGTTGNLICATCGFDSTHCVGHFGHIELADYVFHFGYINYIKKILSCICLKCSKLLIYKNREDILELVKNKTGKSRFNEIKNVCKKVQVCAEVGYGCGAPVTKIKIDKKKNSCSIDIISEYTINVEAEGDKPASKKIIKERLTPQNCFDILKNISNTDCELLGLNPTVNRPEYMIHKIFPVSPVAIRPSVKVVELSTKEDDLTIKLAEIIKANVRARKGKETQTEASAKYSIDNLYLLQYRIYTNFDNESCAIPKSEQGNKTMTSLSSRLKGKEGRFRGNLMGKRVDFCARTVITGDPTIEMDQLRLPIRIARNLTFPEVVTPANIDHLTQLCKNGRDIYPGANFVHPVNSKSSRQIDLRYGKGKIELKFGDVVERHLINDDYVLVNRQPSLHKLSMMGHRIKIIHNDKINTFGLSVAVTTPYNADFDGDEMNIFVPQSCQTRIELEEIADVKKQIITPKRSDPIMGLGLDSVIGSYNLTNPNVKVHWKTAMNIMSYTNADLTKLEKNKTYTGNELYSMILPSDLNMTNNIVINNGNIVKGRIGGALVKEGGVHNIVHNILVNNGYIRTKEFINDAQRLANNYNLYNGFTVGIGDSTLNKELQDEIKVIIKTKILEMNHMITEVENNTDIMDSITLEDTIKGELASILGNISKLIMSKIDSTNNFGTMILSKSKGSESNYGQICGCSGQTLVENKRIQKKFNGRTMSYFPQHDDSALSRGFIEQAMINGLNPREFIFLNMAAREGLMDTAIKTATTGYIQRRLVKCLEDLLIKYDMTVRTASNMIIQFIYGDSGVNTTKQSKQELKFLEYADAEIIRLIKFTSDELSKYNFDAKLNDEFINRVLKLRNKLRKYRQITAYNNITFESTYMMPINFTNIILNTKQNKSKSTTKLEPKYIIESLDKLLDYAITKNTCLSTKSYELKNRSYKYMDELASKLTLRFALYQYLAPKLCIVEYGFSREDFDNIISYIANVYNNSIIEPGEMVGIVGAQSLGESTTQMSCVGSTNILIFDNATNNLYNGPIGPFIDNIINLNSSTVIKFGNNNKNQVLDLTDNYYICGINNNERINWNCISQVSKHPANGGLVKITTQTGRSTTATLSHSFLKRGLRGIEPIKGSDLKIGDRVPVSKRIPLIELNSNNMKYKPDGLFGIFTGIYLLNGRIVDDNKMIVKISDEYKLSINKFFECNQIAYISDDNLYEIHNDELIKFMNTNFGTTPNNKHLSGFVYSSVYGSDYARHILNVLYQTSKSNLFINHQSDRLLNDLIILLNMYDIFAIKKLNNIVINNNFNNIIPNISHTIRNLVSKLNPLNKNDIYRKLNNDINCDDLIAYYELFVNIANNLNPVDRILIDDLLDNLYDAIYSDVVWDRIVQIELLDDPNTFVYDFTVPGNDSFMVDNGIIVHNTLKSFHTAGKGSSVSAGVPRIQELLGLSRNMKEPRMEIYIKKKYRQNLNIVSKINSQLKNIRIKDVRRKIEIYFDPKPFGPNSWMAKDNVQNVFYKHNQTKNSCQSDIVDLPWLIRIELDKEQLLEKNITLLDIKSKFCHHWEKRTHLLRGANNEEKALIDKITRLAILSNYDNSKQPVIHFRVNLNEFDFMSLNDFTNVFIDNFKLKGLSNIERTDLTEDEPLVIFDKKTGELRKEKQHVIYTNGVNMVDIRYINGIDLNKTICNDVMVIYDLFGIDAVRNTLIKQFTTTFKDTGAMVNYAHIELLCDYMTHSGIPVSMDRHGKNKLQIDTFARASFEQPVENLLNSAVFGEVDHMTHVSSRIMAGLVIKGGTGLCNILLNSDLLEKSEYRSELEQEYVKSYNEVSSNNVMDDILNKDVGDIFVPV